MKYTAFDISSVLQRDPCCVNALRKELDYLLSLDADRFLAGFRENAGLPKKAERYGGWEEMLIAGHTPGHYLTAAAQAVANPGTSRADGEALRQKLDYMVSELKLCQENSKGKPGFLFAGILKDPADPELQFDHVEHGRTNIITEAWVPWYTMHKILAGLLSVSALTGNTEALEVAKGLGDWTLARVRGWSEETHRTVIGIEYGGMNDALYELYRQTGEECYAEAAHAFDQEELFERIYAGGCDVLNNLHANTTIPKFMGALMRYITCHGKVIGGQTVDATRYLAYAERFWTMVVEKHTYITGANSEWEHFGQDGILDAERTNANNETCNVYNMLKLSRALFEITGEKKYADYYERAFINSILSSQNPETGMTMYFQPMATGYFKVYGEPFTKFWCCTGSGMENFTKLGDSAYFHNDDTIVVNLYLASVLEWKERGIKLVQSGDVPYEDTAFFTLSGEGLSGDLKLAFRLPDYLAAPAVIRKNGEAVQTAEADGYAILAGPFAEGDRISVTLPAKVRAHGLQDNPSVLAFTYGPFVLSADLGCEEEEVTTTGVIVTIPKEKRVKTENLPLPAGETLSTFAEHADRYLLRDETDPGNLVFRLAGTDLQFGPHYLKYRERYGIYWYFRTQEELRAAEEGTGVTERVIDTVQPGYGQYESDELHAMEEKDTVGTTEQGTSRHARSGGSFSYRMAVDNTCDGILSVTLRTAEAGRHLLISCRGEQIADLTPAESAEEFQTAAVPIPAELLRKADWTELSDGRSMCTLRFTFTGPGGEQSAGAWNFIYTKALRRG